jgi:CheY-like chemotaxis protein
MINLLIVGDSVEARLCVGEFLQREKGAFTVSTTSNAQALEALDRYKPDIVLAELDDRAAVSLELMTRIRQQSPFVPMILVAYPGTEKMLMKMLRLGASSFVAVGDLGRILLSALGQVLALSRKERRCQRLVGFMTGTECSFLLDNDHTLVPSLMGYLQEGLTRMKLCDAAETVQVGIALGEALWNALYHGNLEISSALRQHDEGAFLEEAEERRQLSPYKYRRIHVNARIDSSEAVYVIRDEGPGFDYSALPDPTAPANLEKSTGRGILLIRAFMDEVIYNDKGNQITMVKRRKTEPCQAPCGS